MQTPTHPLTPTPDPMVGIKRSEFSFSEHGHVAYQIKENHECCNMVAKNLHADNHLSIFGIFRKMNIVLVGMNFFFDIFLGSSQNWASFRVISMQFRVFF